MAAQFNINLQQVVQAAFGIRRQVFQPVNTSDPIAKETFAKQQQAEQGQISFDELPQLQFDDSSVKTTLGTLVVSPITFKAGSYKERLSNGDIANIKYEELMLSPTAIIEVRMNKLTVKTPKYGGRGTFKEQTGFDDPTVTIRGVLIGEDLKRPAQQIRQLVALKQVPSEIRVVCDYLSWLGINYLVIDSLKFPPLKGQPSTQPFELTCTADEPVQLI